MQVEIATIWIILMFWRRKATLSVSIICYRLLASKLQGPGARVVSWPGVGLQRICLKVKEFEIVCSLVPFVLLVVLAWSREFSRFVFVFESAICAELQIWNWLWLLDDVQALVLFAEVTSRSYVGRCALVDFCYSRLFYESRISHLIVLSCKQNKVIRCSSLEFFVGNSFVMLSVILPSSWIISPKHDIKGLLHAWFESGVRLLRVVDNQRVSAVVSSSAWDLILRFLEPLNFHIKRVAVTALLWAFLCWILSIVLRSWCSKLTFENSTILISTSGFEGGGAVCSCFGGELGQKVLWKILSRS